MTRSVFIAGILAYTVVVSSGPAETAAVERPSLGPGQSATLLSDGRWLVLGGESVSGVEATALLWDTAEGGLRPAASRLGTARAGHTATVLPDGTVLVLGGTDGAGGIAGAELFDPTTESFQSILLSGTELKRRGHTATLLTDGTVLVAGGADASGVLLDAVDVIDPETSTARRLSAKLHVPREGAEAVLRGDGTVLIWGGRGTDGLRQDGEVFDQDHGTFTPVGVPDVGMASNPAIGASSPQDGATDVPVEGIVVLRFTGRVAVDSVNDSTVVLSGPNGPEPAQVVAAETGILSFVTPRTALELSSDYVISLNGVLDTTGRPVATTVIRFHTQDAAKAPGALPGVGGGHTHAAGSDAHAHDHGTISSGGSPGFAELDDWEWRGERRNGKPYSRWQDLPPFRAPEGVTALAGQVLRSNGQPLADVTIQVGHKTARTDASGRFLLSYIYAGYPTMTIQGATANRPGRTYGHFTVGVDIEKDQTNVLPYTIWMPLIDTVHATPITVPTAKAIIGTTPLIPGLEVHVPAGVILETPNGPLTSIALTRVPVDRPPFPLPEGAKFFFTPQTHSALVQLPDARPSPTGVRFILPNIEDSPPGARVALQTYDSQQRWYTYGYGTVSQDGRQIVPDAGVQFHTVTCAFILGAPESTVSPPVGGVNDGDPVDLATGLFVYEKTDLIVGDVIPIVIGRKYRQGATNPYAFGIGIKLTYDIYLTGDTATYSYADLVLPDGGKVHYARTSAGTGYTDAVMEHTGTPTRFYKSRLAWNATRGGWDLTFRDGMMYQFLLAYPGSMLVGIVDRAGNRLSIARPGTHGNRASVITSPNGRWVEFTWDALNRITQVRDNGGRTVSYAYDATSRLASVTDANGGVTGYTYNSNHQMLTITDPRNITYLTNTYDPVGGASSRITSQTQADNTTYQFAYTVDGSGKVTQTDVTDPRGTVRRITFNTDGYPLSDTRAYGQTEAQATTYVRQSGTNLVTSMTDALSRTTTYAYDTMGNVTSVTRLDGTADAVTTSFTYEATFNQLASVTDPLTHTTSFSYDTSGNLVTITDPLSHALTMTYNGAGQPLTITDALSHTVTLTYDSGDLVSVTDPLGNVTTRFSDAVGRLAAVTNPLGQRTRYTYDALNQITTISDALAGLTQLAYDSNGNLTSVTDARSNATTYAYNSMDRGTSRTDPLTHAESYAYDNNGNLTTFTDRKSQASTSTYDRLNRRTQLTYADSSTTTFTWDAGNRLTQIADSLAGTITRTYDGLDRLTQETTPHGTTTYTYDAAGRRASMAVTGETTVTYSYDDANRLTGTTQGSATVTYGYDNANRRTAVTLSSGVSTEYAYDNANRLTGLTYKYSGTTVGALTYTYDAAGNRTVVGGSWARTGQPAAVTSATYNANNQQTAFGTTTLTYDLNGNLTNDGTSAYTWNARNQLASISGGVMASFGYDALGRRDLVTTGGGSTYTLFDGVDPVKTQTDSASGSPTKYTVRTGLGIDERHAFTDTSGTVSMVADALGATVALITSTGTVATNYTYEAFGATTVTGTATTSPYDFTGRESDVTGLKYFRARYYHPLLQRFVSEDPARLFAGDSNFYSYVGNSPTASVDPLGLWSKDLHAALTKVAAKACGLSERATENLVNGNVGMDQAGPFGILPSLSTLLPWNRKHGMPHSKWWKFVNGQFDKAVGLGADPAAWNTLGKGLHALQDAYAHDAGDAGMWDHVRYWLLQALRIEGINPDNPDHGDNHTRYDSALQASIQYIGDFMRARGKSPNCAAAP